MLSAPKWEQQEKEREILFIYLMMLLVTHIE
jgi:hypothetical protein